MKIELKNNRTVTIHNRPRRWHRIRGNVVVHSRDRWTIGCSRSLREPLVYDLGRRVKKLEAVIPGARFYRLR